MKQIKVKFPVNAADSFASYCFNNGINILLSYTREDFFNTDLYCIIAVPDEFTPEFMKGDFAKHKI